jgi:superfamily II DNA or RNA helicase
MTVTSDRPAPRPVVLRPYQEAANGNTLDLLLNKKRRGVAVVMPTGSGKSLTMAKTAVDWVEKTGRGVLIIAHFRGLVTNNRRAVERLGFPCYVHHGPEKNADWYDIRKHGGVISASIQSLSEAALAKMPADAVGLVLIDEGHHAVLDSSYHRVLKHFGSPPVALYSATPERLDGKALVGEHALCDDTALNYQMLDAIQDGWILLPKIRYELTLKLNWAAVPVAGDITEADCEKIYQRHKADYAVMRPVLDKHDGMQTLVFTPSVRLAKLWAELANDDRPRWADYVASYRPGDYADVKGEFLREDRDRIEADFESGALRFLMNQGVYLEGMDLVAARMCVLGTVDRVEVSKSKYIQKSGRVVRPCNGPDGVSILAGLERATPAQRLERIAASAKPDCVIMDFSGSSGRFDFTHPVDLFITRKDCPAKVREDAIKIMSERAARDQDVDALEALREAEERYQRFLVRDARVRQSLVVTYDSVTKDINPFGGGEVTGGQRYVHRTIHPPSPQMLQAIRDAKEKLGHKPFSESFYQTLGKAAAGSILGKLRAELTARREKQPVPPWLAGKLTELGVYHQPDNYQAALKLLKSREKAAKKEAPRA